MMNTNREYAKKIALNETGNENGDETKNLSEDDNTPGRSFGITDLWSIRRITKTFKIHNRIPRL